MLDGLFQKVSCFDLLLLFGGKAFRAHGSSTPAFVCDRIYPLSPLAICDRIYPLSPLANAGEWLFPGRFRFLQKKSQQGASTVDAPGCVFFMENGVDLGKPRRQTSDLGVIWGIAGRVTLAYFM